MPFLIGMCVSTLAGLDLEGVVVVDLDAGSVLAMAGGDEAGGGGRVRAPSELLPWAGCAARTLFAVERRGWTCRAPGPPPSRFCRTAPLLRTLCARRCERANGVVLGRRAVRACGRSRCFAQLHRRVRVRVG